jgi:hypothetical protein
VAKKQSVAFAHRPAWGRVSQVHPGLTQFVANGEEITAMTRFLMVALVLVGAIAPLGCQSDPCDPCNDRPGLFGRWRAWRTGYEDNNCCCNGSTLGTPVYTEGGVVVGPTVSSGIPMAPPALPGPVGS